MTTPARPGEIRAPEIVTTSHCLQMTADTLGAYAATGHVMGSREAAELAVCMAQWAERVRDLERDAAIGAYLAVRARMREIDPALVLFEEMGAAR